MLTENMKTKFTSQLSELIDEYKSLRLSAKYHDLSDLGRSAIMKFITRSRAAIHRISGTTSTYSTQCEEILKAKELEGYQADGLLGVLESLHADIQANYLENVSELLHGNVFGDFLEMAQHLLNEKYKDAAAVIAGGVLEVHLRRLCEKAGIDTENNLQNTPKPKKAERMNSDLAAARIYSKLDQKNVTAWFDLRNKAAHAHYKDYESAQVNLLISGIRDFITRHPA